MNEERPVLIVDGANLFLRSWAAYPSMSSHGYQMGGCIGFMKTLGRILHEMQPRSVYVVWEGGGSQRRRKLYADYKLGRKPEKLNRFYGDDIPDSEENKKHQLISLLGMLKNVPVCQVYASDCEGDDVVAYLCRGPFKNNEKIIVSSDKDMYQLLDDKTKIYSLHKKRLVTEEEIFEEFRIKTFNFAVAKALCGDPGDNVPGIKGLGFKTVAKRLPFLGNDQELLLQDVIDFCRSHLNESIIYRRIVDQENDVKRNWQLVHLDGSMLSAAQISKVQHVIDTFKPQVNRIGLIKALVKEGVGDFDVEGFFYAFNCTEVISTRGGDQKC
jgi:5'-3' exonuclease